MEARIIIVGAMTLIIFAVGGCLWLIETEGGPWTASFLMLIVMAFNLGVTALYAGVRAISAHRH